MRHASLFSGIGGPEVAAAMLGWENVFHCEINEFGRKVLEYWFPNSESYEDITKTDFRKFRGTIDVLTGGFPCQPFSYAGKRGGQQDQRYLWPEMLRVINEVRPTWVIGENVAGIGTMVEQCRITDLGSEVTLFEKGNGVHRYSAEFTFTIERICKDLESEGYSVQPVLIPACAVSAPHRRDRIFSQVITPTAVMTCENPDNMRARAERKGYQNGTKFGSLESQVMYDPKCSHLLPTPAARDWKGRTNPGVVKEGSGCKYGETLPDVIWRISKTSLIPTPTATDYQPPYAPDKMITKDGVNRNSLLRSLPTQLGCYIPAKDGVPSRLSPLFTEEMMGFPLMWTSWPFLSESGERSQ